MTGRLAILAGSGVLPTLVAQAHPQAMFCGFQHLSYDRPAHAIDFFSLERLGALFDSLRTAGVTKVVLAGAMQRPAFDPELFDAFTRAVIPDLSKAMRQGDDFLLRFVIGLFESQGFDIVGADQLVPNITAEPGLLLGKMSRDYADEVQKADHVLKSLAAVDVGQGVVVEAGQLLAIETLQGTDFMLKTVAQTAAALRNPDRGIFVKRPKAGQDLRADMPAIGVDTLSHVAAAGLAGIVVTPKKVLLLEREKITQRCSELNIFLQARESTQ